MTKGKNFLIICFIASAFYFTSCKESVKENKNNYRQWYNPNVELEDVFSINLNLLVLFDDVFKVYYTLDGTSNYNEDQTIKAKVKGFNSNQNIVFKFPNGIKPTNIRIDFGRNKKQELFKINSLNIGYQKNNVSIPSFQLFTYFNYLDNQLSFNSDSKMLSIVQNANNTEYLPIIWSKETLNNKIRKLSKTMNSSQEADNVIINYTQDEFTRLQSNAKIKNNIESFSYDKMVIKVKGWAYVEDVDSKDTRIQLLLIDDHLVGYFIETIETSRPDVTEYFKLDYNANNSGFDCDTTLEDLPNGNYRLGVFLENDRLNKQGLFLSNNEIKIN